MSEFSFVRAWTKGLGLFSGAALNNAILLLGMGILLPIATQVLMFGRPMVMMDPASRASQGSASIAIASVVGFILPTASFLASSRMVLGRGVTLRGALDFGLAAGLLLTVGFAVVLIVLGAASGLIAASLAFFVVLFAAMGLVAIAWTTLAALIAVAICLLFLLALGFGIAMGDMSFAATLVGGAGWVWSLMIAASLMLLWLAARLSCTMAVMAERRSLNLFAAMRESWSLTWDDEWRIVRYLALVGLAMAVVIFAPFIAAGAGLAATLRGGDPAMGGMVAAILTLIVSIPLAYLTVLVPAGIYRELAPVDYAAVEVFA